MHRTIQLCSISIDGHGPARPASWRARKHTVALITATPGLDAARPSTRDRWDCIGAALLFTSRNTWTNRGGIGPSLHPRDLAPNPKDPAGEGALPCLGTRVSTITPLAVWVPVLVLKPVLSSRLGAGTWKHAVEQGTGFLVPARLASPNCLASPAKSTSDDLLDRLQGSACSTIVLHHRIVFVVL